MTNVYPTYEILGSFLSCKTDDAADSLKATPKTYIADNFGIHIQETDITVVSNEADTMHLALPYYSKLDSINISELDKELEDVHGGEVVITIISYIALAGVVVAGAGAVVGIGAHFGTKKK